MDELATVSSEAVVCSGMGELIILADRLADRSRPSRRRAAFFFDLACPFSYLASERIERSLGDVDWIPVAPVGGPLTEARRAEAEQQAAAANLPLVWPERMRESLPRAMRAAAYAAEVGRAGAFALAAGRLAFCGGFDLEDPEILADAAAAAAISPGEVLTVICDSDWEAQPRATAAGLTRRGVAELPAIRVERHWRCGERAVGEAIALMRASAASGQAFGGA